MALYKCAGVKRIDASYKTRMTRVDGIIFHIAVSNAPFPSYLPGTKAHFYVRKDGTIVQEIDTAFRSGANLEGNPFYLSVETEGGVGNDVNNPWTQAQVESLAVLAKEAAQVEGFPIRQMNSSKIGEQGVGWHRLGIDGNFPPLPSILAGRIQRGGGRKFSKSRGKVCPTDSRIVQIPHIIQLAQGEDDHMSKQDVEDLKGFINGRINDLFGTNTAAGVVRGENERQTAWITGVPTGKPLVDQDGNNSSLTGIRRAQTVVFNDVRWGHEQDRALAASLTKSLEDNGVDPAVIEKAVNEALSDITITLTTQAN